MEHNEFVFNCVHLLHYKYGKNKYELWWTIYRFSCLDKNKKAIIILSIKKIKNAQYAVAVALNHEEIGKHSEGITKIKPFINKYSWEGINVPSEKDKWKNVRKTIK